MKHVDIAQSNKSFEKKWAVKIYVRLESFQYKVFFQSWSPIMLLCHLVKCLPPYHRLGSTAHKRWCHLRSKQLTPEMIYWTCSYILHVWMSLKVWTTFDSLLSNICKLLSLPPETNRFPLVGQTSIQHMSRRNECQIQEELEYSENPTILTKYNFFPPQWKEQNMALSNYWEINHIWNKERDNTKTSCTYT